METNICKIKFRRGIEEERRNIDFIPEEGEPIFTTDTYRFCIGDGNTPGGITYPRTFINPDDKKSIIKGDIVYSDKEGLKVFIKDDESVIIGGTGTYAFGSGFTLTGKQLDLDPGTGIVINTNGISISNDYIAKIDSIVDTNNKIDNLSANTIQQIYTPLYNTATVYVNLTAANVKRPLRVSELLADNVLTIKKVIKDGDTEIGKVYDLDIDNTTLTNYGASAFGIDVGEVINCDNSIGISNNIDEYVIDYAYNNTTNTYTLSTAKLVLPRLSVDTSNLTPQIKDGSITEKQLESNLQKKINDSTINKIYPVGSIYMSVNGVNPSELFGGSWEQIKDRFLLAAGNTYNAGSVGGEATHKLAVDEMPTHTHQTKVRIDTQHSGSGDRNRGLMVSDVGLGSWDGEWCNSNTTSDDMNDIDNKTAHVKNNNIGGDQPHNNMPPYLTVYMWKRTS